MSAEESAQSMSTAPALTDLVAAAREGRVEIDPNDVAEDVIEALRSIHDPEIPVNIYELGLIYDIDIRRDGSVAIQMTLTAPGCPVAGEMPGQVRDAVAAVPGITDVSVDLVWDPPWDKSRMSEEARLALDMF